MAISLRRPTSTFGIGVRTVLGAIVFAAVVFWPALTSNVSSSATSYDPVTITDYTARFDVDKSGTLHATETVTTDFPAGRHGIFRYFDTTAPWDSHVRLVPTDIHVTQDGQPAEVAMSWENGRHYRVAKVGDPESYVSQGQHVYVISYVIDGALAPVGAGSGSSSGSWVGGSSSTSAFYWNVVAGGWSMPIDASTTTVTLPELNPTTLKCVAGWDSSLPCDASVADGVITTRTGQLAPDTPVTLRAEVGVPSQEHKVWWTPTFDGVFGQSTSLFLIILALGVVGLVIGRLWEWSTREKTPGYPVMYEPPTYNGAVFGPVQASFVMDEAVPSRGLVASLLQAADKKLLTLTKVDNRHWQVKVADGVTESSWSEVDEVTQAVVRELGFSGAGSVFDADGSRQAGLALNNANAALARTASSWAREQKLLVAKGSESLGIFLVVAAVVIGGALALWHPGGESLWGIPFLAFALGGIGMPRAGVGTRRTAAGREAWSRAGGFRRLLSTPSAEDRFDFSAKKDLYTAFIPYAVAFDCADAWAKKYKVATGQEPPIPFWYLGYAYGFGGFGGGDVFDDFQSSLDSSIGAYQASQRASSGGGGGGFSGGGGGGGGGGGSW